MKNRQIISWSIRLCIGALAFFSVTSHAAPKPVLHKATVRIYMKDSGSSKPGSLSSGNPYFLRTQIEILQSKPILYEVAKRLNLAENWSVDGTNLSQDAVHEILKGSLTVYQHRDTTLIAISVKHSDPSEAAKIANTIAETFRDSRLEVLEKENHVALAVLAGALKKQKDRVVAAEKKVEQCRVEYKIPADGSHRIDVQNMRLMRLEDARHSALMAKIGIKAKLQILKDHAEEDLLERTSFICFDPRVLNSAQQLQELKIQITLLKAEQGDEHPELKRSRLQKQKLEKTLAARLSVLEKSLKSEYALSEKMFEALDAELDGLQSAAQAEVISRRKEEKPYRNAESALESEQFIFKQLKSKVEEERVAMKDPKSPVEIISLADPSNFN